MNPLNPALLDEISNNNFNKLCNKNKLQDKKSNYNKTIKKRSSDNQDNQDNKKSYESINSNKAANMYDIMSKIHSTADESISELENFTTLEDNNNNNSIPDLENYQTNYQTNYQSNYNSNYLSTNSNNNSDIAVSNELYNNLTNSGLNNNDHIPYYKNYNKNVYQNGSNNDDLLSKLNYIIHLLEEQQNERTNYITEELILYTFLGIFIIFIIDSFARASKYVR